MSQFSTSRVNRQELNEAQYAAATTGNGPVLVIAGAGSGKTRTLVYRLAYLIEQGVAPERILLLTFTRKAAQEMLLRASQLMDDSCQRVVGGTFHAVANSLLRRYCRYLGYESNFTILDQNDAEGIVNLIKSSLSLGGESKRFPSRRIIVSILSKSVNKNIAVEDLLAREYAHLLDYETDLLTIREHYQKFKIEHGLMDYDDLLVNWQRLLRNHPEVHQELGERFSHIMVDEYQDTNPIQADIVRLMASQHGNVMAVGDDSQSIYSFRGADFRNIMDFPTIFPAARIIRLEENYRSTQKILQVTNAIIEQAQEKYSKTLFSRIESEERPVIHAAQDETAQARFVAEKIVALREQGFRLGDIAVLFRSGFHSYKLELELGTRHLDFEKRGGLKLTESSHIKDVLSYLRIMANPQDNLSWNRILLQLDKVGPKTAQKMVAAIKAAEDPLDMLRSFPAGKAWGQNLRDLVGMLENLQKTGSSPAGMFDMVMDYYRPVFERLYHDDYPRRSRDLEQLKIIMAGYTDLQTFLDDTALDPPHSAGEGAAISSPQEERLILSTIHSAKGLEWDTVFIINLANGRFPSAQALLPEHFEEERRLLYVAATRAKRKLFFVYPLEVPSYEPYGLKGGVSPFLETIPRELVSQSELRQAGFYGSNFCRQDDVSRARPKMPEVSAGKEKAAAVAGDVPPPGTKVRHQFFGEGRIDSRAGDRSVKVFFQRHGFKTLHLDYAKLEVLP